MYMNGTFNLSIQPIDNTPADFFVTVHNFKK